MTDGDAGVAHVSTEDDVYNGYFIPKGAILLPNIWYVASPPLVILSTVCR